MKKIVLSALLSALAFGATSANATVVSATNDANLLASTIGGTGITISNAVLNTASDVAAGTFSNGGNIGFNSGVLLTTGNVACGAGSNSMSDCAGPGEETSLKFDFVSATGEVFFNYIFASEEYNEWVGSEFNDVFELKLNGVNIALVPGSSDFVTINNVNNGSNSAFFRDNNGGAFNTEFDGLTTVLTAKASGLVGVNTFEFVIRDIGDDDFDSGVFIQAGTFSNEPTDVPEPGSVALLGLGLAGLVAARRKKAA